MRVGSWVWEVIVVATRRDHKLTSECWILTPPRVEINPGIMLHQWEVIIVATRRDHKLTPDGHLPRSEDPHSGMCRCDRLVLLPDRRMRGKSMS
jgi:hypothetical protein